MVRSNYIDLAEVNRRVREDPKEFVAECERGYAEQVSAAADMIIENMKKSPKC